MDNFRCVNSDTREEIMQGDQYAIPFRFTDGNGRVITDNDVLNAEIIIGNLKKQMPAVSYNAETGMWEFPLTQQETFSFASVNATGQVRIKFPNGDIIGQKLPTFKVERSASREVL